MKLSDLHTGERGVIVKTGGHGGFRKRIAEMGFVRGKSVKVLLNAPLLDPIEYEIMGYKISLRREEAALVEVIGESEAENLADKATEALTPLKPDVSDKEEQWQNLQHRMEQMAEQKQRTIRVALVGNPNCGKTSLFNIASGAHEHVGNYSGVTVGVKTGTFRHAGYDITLVDLPGTYSLSAYSPEERFVRQQLTDDAPDVVVNVVDATNLERNLYLTTQLIDMNLRMVVALNMYDEVEKRGDKLDRETLGLLLGVPMVPTQSRGGQGVETLFDTVIAIYNEGIGASAAETVASPAQNPASASGHVSACQHCHGQCLQLHTRHIHVNHGAELEQSINLLKAAFKKNLNLRSKYSTRYLAISFLEGNADIESLVETLPNHDELISLRYAEQRRIKEELNESPGDALIAAKYGFIAGALRETHQPGNGHERRHNRTSRIDSIVTNRYLGFPLFFLVLF
ncbi:MAG: 50S ribosome-binding GTPase, partial [Bacteroidaceae bacterium]|nr:50S ribosome-binding GTPase [Bacteroidaceae bacterium]